MSPGLTLTTAGRACLASATFGLLGGVALGRPLAVAVGALTLALLVTARLSLAARLAAAGQLRFTARLPRGAGAARGAPLALEIEATHQGSGPALPCRIHLRLTGGPAGAPPRALHIPAHSRGTLSYTLRFPQAGHWHLHGIEVNLQALGLARAWGYAPLERRLTIHPRPAALASQPLRRGARREQQGPHPARREGDGVELRELRDYVPGDPLRSIAWRATARRRSPVVSAREEETRRRLQLIVDQGPTMRAGVPGETPLDTAIDGCAALVDRHPHDRLGLTTFDHRVHGHLDPSAGPTQRRRILAQLLDLHRIIDADLTEIARGELIWRVGRFLSHQEGLTLGEQTDPDRHARLAMIDPLAETFDAGALYAAVTERLAAERAEGHAALFARPRPATDLLEARLRLLCALRGIPLPYRLAGPLDACERGLRAALLRALRPGGPEELILWSTLAGVRHDGPALDALALARHRKRSVRLYCPRPLPDPLRRRLALLRITVEASPTPPPISRPDP